MFVGTIVSDVLFTFYAGRRSFDVRLRGGNECFDYEGKPYGVIGCLTPDRMRGWSINPDGTCTLEGNRYSPDWLVEVVRQDTNIRPGVRVLGRLVDEAGSFRDPMGNEPEIVATLPVR